MQKNDNEEEGPQQEEVADARQEEIPVKNEEEEIQVVR